MPVACSIACTLSAIRSVSAGGAADIAAASCGRARLPRVRGGRSPPRRPGAGARRRRHERGHLDGVLVQQVQDPGHPLAGPVLIEAVLPEIGEAGQDRLGDRAPARLTGCPPASNCMDTLTASRAPSGQNPFCSVTAIDSFICVRVREPASRSTAHPFSQAPPRPACLRSRSSQDARYGRRPPALPLMTCRMSPTDNPPRSSHLQPPGRRHPRPAGRAERRFHSPGSAGSGGGRRSLACLAVLARPGRVVYVKVEPAVKPRGVS